MAAALQDNWTDTTLMGLAAALAVGLVIGLERGWQERDRPEGRRVAGLRSFALMGLLGGALASLREALGAAPLAVGLGALALVGAAAYRENARASGSLSVTTTVAALLTLVLGAVAVAHSPLLALAVAVVAAVLLAFKPTLHGWLRLIEYRELTAALQLGVLSLVVLPLLPDRGFGPYGALNPYRLWWAVVLVSALSLGGHVAMRYTGAQRGLLWSGVLGGLASSTAVTMSLARLVRARPALRDAASAGILAACGVMFLRMTVLAAALQPALAQAMGLPLVAAGGVLIGLALRRWRASSPGSGDAQPPVTEMTPYDLGAALGFAAFLGLIAVLSRAGHALLGEQAVYGVALLSGLADVDALVISVTRLHASAGLGTPAAVLAVGLAACANIATKSAIAATAGDLRLGMRLVAAHALALLVALVVALASLAGGAGAPAALP